MITLFIYYVISVIDNKINCLCGDDMSQQPIATYYK